MKKIAILQSDYIPWKGYFDIIRSVDEFIIYDEVQFTKNDWRNRNIIKSSNGLQWLTIACRRESIHQKISEVKVFDRKWSEKHIKALKLNYAKASCYHEMIETVSGWYESAAQKELLSEVNTMLLKDVCKFLGIRTTISQSYEFKKETGRNKRLIGICKQTAAGIYLTGSAAKEYLDEEAFNNEGITIHYMDYTRYPEYK